MEYINSKSNANSPLLDAINPPIDGKSIKRLIIN